MTPLKAKLLRLMKSGGPIGIADYMRIALTDREHGYYMRKEPFGPEGDFTTAPEVSQMFGEILGLFFVQAWHDRGCPKPFRFAEIGPGRGTLMADMLRAARVRPAFLDAAGPVLIETSPVLRRIQEKTLAGMGVSWAEGLSGLDGAPLFLAANEFLDALPARQMIRSDSGWHERMIAERDGELVFTRSAETVPPDPIPPRLRDAPDGAIFEFGAGAIGFVRQAARAIARDGGVALFADYGHARSGLGDTFQAVKNHRYADPLAGPGEADLTFHIDFEALAACARAAGVRVSGPETQGAFLKRLGIEARAEVLSRASPGHANETKAALERLTGEQQMGSLFRVLALSEDESPLLPGFPC